MSLRDEIPHLKEALKLCVAASIGALMMGTWTLSRGSAEAAYYATDGMMYIAMGGVWFGGILWLALDIDDWSEIEVSEWL